MGRLAIDQWIYLNDQLKNILERKDWIVASIKDASDDLELLEDHVEKNYPTSRGMWTRTKLAILQSSGRIKVLESQKRKIIEEMNDSDFTTYCEIDVMLDDLACELDSVKARYNKLIVEPANWV